MTADDLIRRVNELPTNTYPPYGQPVTIDDDAWAGQLVVKAADVLHLVSWLLTQIEHRREA
jgi:hypothetical protein